MNDQHIARFEAHLEGWVEGAFAHLFGRRLRAHDLALHLARAMEDAALPGSPRPLAPDQYIIWLHPDALSALLKRQPSLAVLLGEHLVELASDTGYRLDNVPLVQLQTDSSLSIGQITVRAQHLHSKRESTALMKRVDIPNAQAAPLNPHLLINGQTSIPLGEPIINIGRSRDNHIVIDDNAVSRYHLQLRLRAGRYLLFDTQSKSGTFVNNVPMKEHSLQTGDVIRIGNTQLVYMEDQPTGQTPTGTYMPVESPE